MLTQSDEESTVVCFEVRGRSVSRRRSSRRSRIGDLALLDPFSLIEGLGLRPTRLRGDDLLELLGEDEEERIDNVVAMLRRSSPEDVNELARIVQLGLARVAEERANDASPREADVLVDHAGEAEGTEVGHL